MDYESSYNSARSRYYNACSEINSRENRVNELNQQKTQIINLINQLKVDIKNNQDAIAALGQIINSDTGLNEKFNKITISTNEAATNYSRMIQSGKVTSKNLNDVYNDETQKTRQTLHNIFEDFRTKLSILQENLAELEKELRNAEGDLQNVESGIRSTQSSLQDWRRTKSNASYDMEYYRRKMNEAV